MSEQVKQGMRISITIRKSATEEKHLKMFVQYLKLVNAFQHHCVIHILLWS